MNPLLSLRHLSRTVTVNGESKTIVDDISFDFEAGRIYNVLGPSGAGKSSLLRLINRLDEPTSGEIVFKDQTQSEYSPCELRRQIGYLFQTPHLFPSTVEDNLRFVRDDLSEQQLNDSLEQTHLGREMLAASVDNLAVLVLRMGHYCPGISCIASVIISNSGLPGATFVTACW